MSDKSLLLHILSSLSHREYLRLNSTGKYWTLSVRTQLNSGGTVWTRLYLHRGSSVVKSLISRLLFHNYHLKIPIDPLALERREVWRNTETVGKGAEKLPARKHRMGAWQKWWTEVEAGLWTNKPVPRIDKWVQQQHGEVPYLTQLLSGHGYFQAYLKIIQKVQSPSCFYYEENDDVYHTFFNCDRWALDKWDLEAELIQITPGNIVPKMLESWANWQNVLKYVERLLRQKKVNTETAEIWIKHGKPKKVKKWHRPKVTPTWSRVDQRQGYRV